MHTLKVVTSVFIVFMIFIILIFSKGLRWNREKSTIVGFSFMEIVYILSLICMWA